MHVEIRRARVPLHRAAAIQRADAAKCWRGSGEMEGILVIGGIWSGRATYWILPSTSASPMNWHSLLFVSESANKRQIVYLPLLHGPWKAALIHHLALPPSILPTPSSSSPQRMLCECSYLSSCVNFDSFESSRQQSPSFMTILPYLMLHRLHINLTLEL